MIPFYDYVVTEANYGDVTEFENHNLRISRVDEGIKIEFKNTYPSNLFFYEKAYSLNEEKLADYLRERGIEVTIDEEYKAWERKKIEDKKRWGIRQLKVNKYKEIGRVCRLWEYIIIRSDMTMDVKFYDSISIGTIPINQSANIIKRWIEKYKSILSTIPAENLIWELSAGYDSRALTYFYPEGANVYSKDCFEYNIAEEVCKRIGAHISSKKGSGKITVRGTGNFKILDICLFENWIGALHSKNLVKDICPYLDMDYLRINGNIKKALNILLCPQLTDIPYFTFCDKKEFFDEKTQKKIKKDFSFLFE